jgi:hypothetical protein
VAVIPLDLRILRILFPASRVSFSVVDFASIAALGRKHPNRRTSNDLDLRDTVRVTENDTNLRGSCALLCELADLLLDLVGGDLEPCWRRARVGEGRGGDALAVAVHATHDCGLCGVDEDALSRIRPASVSLEIRGCGIKKCDGVKMCPGTKMPRAIQPR